MSHKTSPARRAAFFAALRATGNQTLACERARVSRSWMSLQRSTDPQFKDDMSAAIEEAKRHFDPSTGSGQAGWGGTCKPPRGYGHQNGEELVVRGSRGRRVQVARARLHQWTPRVEARFLALLAETCNLRLSLREVGLSAQSLHEHRKRWPAFDARCEEALAIGYERIDVGLAHAACHLFRPDEYPLPDEPAVGPMDAGQAIALMRLHERRRWEARRGIGPGGRVWRWRNAR